METVEETEAEEVRLRVFLFHVCPTCVSCISRVSSCACLVFVRYFNTPGT